MNQLVDEPSLIVPNQQNNTSRFNIVNQLISHSNAQANPQANQAASKLFVNVRISIAALKIIVSGIAVTFYNVECKPDYRRWIITMMTYDILIIIYQFLKMTPENNTNNNNNSVDQGYVLGSNNQENRRSRYDFNNGVDEESGLPRSPSNVNNGQDEARNYFSETCRALLLARIQSLTTFLYLILFGWGQIMFFTNKTTCPAGLQSIFYIYVLFQYVTFAIPFLFICCCLLSMMVVVTRFRHLLPNAQRPASENIINNLPSHKYPLELQGDPECRICMCEYADDEDIIKLQCSEMHHFHAECIKKWLKVNGVCPVCRKTLEEIAPQNAARN